MSNPKLQTKVLAMKFFRMIITPMKSQRNNRSLIHDANDFNDGYAAFAQIIGT